jgi:uncharacterized membrane protein YphA (DoxX/SURF4 family)
MATVTLPASRGKTIVLWVLRILMAALFLFASFMKLTGQPVWSPNSTPSVWASGSAI